MDLRARVIESEDVSFSDGNYSPKREEVMDKLVKELFKDGYLRKKKFTTMPCFKRFSGSGDSLGSGFWYNTSGTSFQMIKTLSMLKHPVFDSFIEDISKNDSISPEEIDISPLIQNKILRGLKIMDLGCGIYPSYTNCVYSLGADIYTADNNPTDNIHFIDKFMKQKHTQVDFNNPDTIRILNDRTERNFDFVTCATVHPVSNDYNKEEIESPSDERLKEIGMSLLRRRGFFYNPEDFENLDVVRKD